MVLVSAYQKNDFLFWISVNINLHPYYTVLYVFVEVLGISSTYFSILIHLSTLLRYLLIGDTCKMILLENFYLFFLKSPFAFLLSWCLE